MKIKKTIILTKKEEVLLTRVLEWYDNNKCELEESDIDLDNDLYNIIEDILDSYEIEED